MSDFDKFIRDSEFGSHDLGYAPRQRIHFKRPIALPKRNNKGSTNPNSKLNEANVREIRESAAQGIDAKEIAERFYVSVSTIKSIIDRKSWK